MVLLIILPPQLIAKRVQLLVICRQLLDASIDLLLRSLELPVHIQCLLLFLEVFLPLVHFVLEIYEDFDEGGVVAITLAYEYCVAGLVD